jgi:hypothetical protein
MKGELIWAKLETSAVFGIMHNATSNRRRPVMSQMRGPAVKLNCGMLTKNQSVTRKAARTVAIACHFQKVETSG